jgi:hypothetical protein
MQVWAQSGRARVYWLSMLPVIDRDWRLLPATATVQATS